MIVKNPLRSLSPETVNNVKRYLANVGLMAAFAGFDQHIDNHRKHSRQHSKSDYHLKHLLSPLQERQALAIFYYQKHRRKIFEIIGVAVCKNCIVLLCTSNQY